MSGGRGVISPRQIISPRSPSLAQGNAALRLQQGYKTSSPGKNRKSRAICKKWVADIDYISFLVSSIDFDYPKTVIDYDYPMSDVHYINFLYVTDQYHS